MSAAGGTTYSGPGAGAEQPAADRALRGIVGVRATGQRQNQCHGSSAADNRAFRHLIPSLQVSEPKTTDRSADKPSISGVTETLLELRCRRMGHTNVFG
jgi:hypothetical protein